MLLVKKIIPGLSIVAAFALGAGAGYFYWQTQAPAPIIQPASQTRAAQNQYTAFLLEIFDKIQAHYWKALPEAELAGLFQKGAEAILGIPLSLEPPTRAKLKALLTEQIQTLPEPKQQELTVKLSAWVLENLQPKGRSQLFTKRQEKKLNDLVKNVDPKTGQAQPTVSAKMLRPNIAYLRLERFSPATLKEFQKQAQGLIQGKTQKPDSLILDLRSNIGGSIDILPYFLGPFIGPDTYAYEFYSQGEKRPFKTKTGWLEALVPYKKVVVLVDKKTQSSAEVMAGTLQKYNVGVIVGQTTRGWGTVERVFDIETQISKQQDYSMLLVHSVTLRPDGQPIEGRGIRPDINITNANWQDQLLQYYNYLPLVEAVQQIWNQKP